MSNKIKLKDEFFTKFAGQNASSALIFVLDEIFKWWTDKLEQALEEKNEEIRKDIEEINKDEKFDIEDIKKGLQEVLKKLEKYN